MTVDAGSLTGWVTILLLLAGLWVFVRGGGGVALSHLREANIVLTKTIEDQQEELRQASERLRDAEREISELRGRTDVSIAIASALGLHEQQAQERHDASLGILQLIADRLGPDANGAT